MRRGVPLLLLLALAGAARAQTPIAERDADDLVRALGHENPSIRIAAVDELGRRREADALVPLLARLEKDPEAAVRAHAAESLRLLGDERAVPRLARTLEDPDATTRCRAVLALGDLGGRYLVPAVARMLRDPSVVVRAAAIRALGELGDPLSLETVLSAQARETDETDQAVTAAAILAAAKLGGVEGLRRSLAVAGDRPEATWFLRAVVARAAAVAGDRERIPWLVARLREDEDPRVAAAAAGALADLGATEELRAAARDEVPWRRRAAVAGLAEAPAAAPGVREALVAACGDPEPIVVLPAATALLGRGEADAFPVVIALLEADPPVWLGALAALEGRTGLEFGRNPPRWTEWYRERKGRLVFRPETGRYEGVR